MQTLLALLIGLTFGLGILISGMGNPAKVLNFFDVAGHWDPSLALVIAGAVSVTAIGYRFVLRWPRRHLAPRFNVPTARTIDASLVMGSAIFGIGWGLSGFCPGSHSCPGNRKDGAAPFLGRPADRPDRDALPQGAHRKPKTQARARQNTVEDMI